MMKIRIILNEKIDKKLNLLNNILFKKVKRHLEIQTYQNSDQMKEYLTQSVKFLHSNKKHKLIVIHKNGHLPFLYLSKQENVFVGFPINKEQASLASMHNNANAIVIPTEYVSKKEIPNVIKSYLDTKFEGGRHKKRLNIIHHSFINGNKTYGTTELAPCSFVIASDHAGFKLKKQIIEYLNSKQWQAFDCGTFSEESVAYSIYGIELGLNAFRGKIAIAICGSGFGIANTVNKFKGINGCICHKPKDVALIRTKYGSNVLVLGARFMDFANAKNIVDKFIAKKIGNDYSKDLIDKLGFEFDKKKFNKLKINKKLLPEDLK